MFKVSDNMRMPRLRYLAAWRALAWLLLVLVIVLSVAPSGVPSGFENGDKIQHLLAYMLLAFCFGALYPAKKGGCLVGLILLGALLEVIQGMLPTRMASLADWIADAVGVGAGIWLASSRVRRLFWWLEARLR